MSAYERVAGHVFSTPWAILPDKLQAIGELLAIRIGGHRLTSEEITARIGGSPPGQRRYEVRNGVAVVPIFGVIDKRMDSFAEISGGTSTDRLAADVAQAMADPEVAGVVFDVDSPGGSVHGMTEVVGRIRAARGRKPMIAVANELMASAAYGIASAAEEVVVVASARTGSIGTVAILRDVSKAADMAGVRFNVIQAGKYKAAGNPYEPLDGEMRDYLQSQIDAYYSLFVDAVASNRGVGVDKVLADMADGRIFVGQEAVKAGLADRVGTLQGVIEELASRGGAGRRASVSVSGAGRGADVADESNAKGATTADATQDGQGAAATASQQQAVEAARQQARAEELERINGIRAMAKGFWPNQPDHAEEVAAHCVKQGWDLTQSKSHVADLLGKERAPLGLAPRGLDAAGDLEVGRASADKFFAAASDGVALRLMSGRALQVGRENGRLVRLTTPRKPEPGANVFRGMRLMDVAREHLALAGVNVRGADPMQVARMALGWTSEGVAPVGAGSGGGGGEYHSSRDFPNLLLDAINKTLLMAFMEAEPTYRRWARQAPSVPDFKTIHRIRLSEAGDLETIPEGEPFPQDQLSDAREFYAVETRGKAFTFTRQMLINDDLNALDVLPTRFGRAAERTNNRVIYSILTGNPAMNDTVALFHTTHKNLVAAGAAPSVAQLNEMQRLLRVQTAVNSNVTTNAEMRYLIVPAALEGTTKELLASMANPASANGNPGVANIWQNRVEPVVEAILDQASPAVYYGAANSGDVDTVEFCFLQGEESPVVEDNYDFKTKGRAFSVHQTFGAKAVDWRGMIKNPGA
jgi:signal peptide peptidase SppA